MSGFNVRPLAFGDADITGRELLPTTDLGMPGFGRASLYLVTAKNSCCRNMSVPMRSSMALIVASRESRPSRFRARSSTSTASGVNQKLLRFHPCSRRLSALRRIDFAAWVFETDSIRIVGLTHIFGKRN
jgi:hypothetical protein